MGADIVRSHVRNGELGLALIAAQGALVSADERERGELYALLSRARSRLGQPREAMAAAEEALRRTDSWEANLALGEACIGIGQPARARRILEDAMSHIGDVVDKDDAEVWIGVALAEAARSAGDAESGVTVGERAVHHAITSFGPQSREAAEALHTLGMSQHAAGRDEAAREALAKALFIRRSGSADHPDVAATLDALGLVARSMRKFQDAERLHREALAIWIAKLGPDAGPVAACRHALAQAMHRTGDFEGARKEMVEAVRITSTAFGPEHVDTEIAKFELGRFEMDVGNSLDGLAMMESARKKVAAVLGEDHPVVKSMDRWL